MLHINMQRFRGGLVFESHRLCVSLNSRPEGNKEEKKKIDSGLVGFLYVSREEKIPSRDPTQSHMSPSISQCTRFKEGKRCWHP